MKTVIILILGLLAAFILSIIVLGAASLSIEEGMISQSSQIPILQQGGSATQQINNIGGSLTPVESASLTISPAVQTPTRDQLQTITVTSAP